MNDDSLKKQLRANFLSLVETGDPKVLHEVSRRSDDMVVLRAVARHANAAPLTLKLFAVINNKSSRKTIVKNKKCP